jgi:hypothetical protein
VLEANRQFRSGDGLRECADDLTRQPRLLAAGVDAPSRRGAARAGVISEEGALAICRAAVPAV